MHSEVALAGHGLASVDAHLQQPGCNKADPNLTCGLVDFMSLTLNLNKFVACFVLDSCSPSVNDPARLAQSLSLTFKPGFVLCHLAAFPAIFGLVSMDGLPPEQLLKRDGPRE